MRDALQSLLRKASAAKRTADFWQAAAHVLSDWAGGALLTVCYQGVNESGAVAAGAAGASGVTLTADWDDPEGRHVEASRMLAHASRNGREVVGFAQPGCAWLFLFGCPPELAPRVLQRIFIAPLADISSRWDIQHESEGILGALGELRSE